MKKKPICTSVALLLAAMSPTMMAVPLASPQLVNVEISVNRTTVGEVIRHLAQQTGYEFSYDDALLSRELSGVTLNVQNERIENVLKEVSKEENIIGLCAEMTIQEWKNGNLKNFYTL